MPLNIRMASSLCRQNERRVANRCAKMMQWIRLHTLSVYIFETMRDFGCLFGLFCDAATDAAVVVRYFSCPSWLMMRSEPKPRPIIIYIVLAINNDRRPLGIVSMGRLCAFSYL